jgi:hypothetical protein
MNQRILRALVAATAAAFIVGAVCVLIATVAQR